MNFLRGFSFNAVCTGLVFGLGFANQWLLANGLGRADFGRLALWTTTAMLGALVLGEWLNKGSTYAAGKGGAQGRLMGNSLAYGLGLMGVLVGISFLAGEARLPFLPERGPVQVPLLLAGLVGLLVLQKAAEAILLGENRIKAYSLLPVLFVLCYLGGNVLVLKGWGGGLEEVLGIWLLSVGLVALAGFILLLCGAGAVGVDRQLWRQTAEVGGRGAVSVILVFLLFRSDLYLVEHFLDEAQVGVYRIAGIFAEMMQRLPNVAGTVLLPRVIRGQAGEQGLSLRVARHVLLFSLLCAGGIIALGKPVLALIFPDYSEAYAPLVWMLPGLVVAGFGSVFNTRLAGQGYPGITLWAPALALAANIALNLFLIPALGLKGAALSTSLAYGLWGGLAAHCCLKQAGSTWGAFLRGRPIAPSIERP